MQEERGSIEHTGLGTGSGKYGFCPGMIEGTRVRVDDTVDGAKLTVRAPSVEQVAALQKSTRERAAAIQKRRARP